MLLVVQKWALYNVLELAVICISEKLILALC